MPTPRFSDRPALPRRIVGFHRDDEGVWVAELACGHGQHLRHDPPWHELPWVTTAEGRARALGWELWCVACAAEAGSSGPLRVALVGDHDPAVLAHQAIPRALALAARAAGVEVEPRWTPTDAIGPDADLAGADAIWCVPASPYRSAAGALRAIRLAREGRRPFLGTCGGFQHALLEYARAVLGWADAAHAELEPDAGRPVVTPLACPLVEQRGVVRFLAGSRLADAYASATGKAESVEGYHCRYGPSPALRDALAAGPLRVSAEDEAGEVRAVELEGHPFFVATLFQPERAALRGELPPIVAAFVRATAAARAGAG